MDILKRFYSIFIQNVAETVVISFPLVPSKTNFPFSLRIPTGFEHWTYVLERFVQFLSCCIHRFWTSAGSINHIFLAVLPYHYHVTLLYYYHIPFISSTNYAFRNLKKKAFKRCDFHFQKMSKFSLSFLPQPNVEIIKLLFKNVLYKGCRYHHHGHQLNHHHQQQHHHLNHHHHHRHRLTSPILSEMRFHKSMKQ